MDRSLLACLERKGRTTVSLLIGQKYSVKVHGLIRAAHYFGEIRVRFSRVADCRLSKLMSLFCSPLCRNSNNSDQSWIKSCGITFKQSGNSTPAVIKVFIDRDETTNFYTNSGGFNLQMAVEKTKSSMILTRTHG